MDVQLEVNDFGCKKLSVHEKRGKTYSRVHENEVHLHEGENHLQKWIDTSQNLMARRSNWSLEECSKFQANVDQGS